MNSYYVLDAGNSTVEKTDMISTIRVPNVNDFTINKEIIINYNKLLDSLNHQRADSRSKKNYNLAACGTKTTFTERQTR